jgi:hypothetical protein
MGERNWTELFFLDEATALAAGHRPCFFCRREAAKGFQSCWARGHGMARPSAPTMDAKLHTERLEGRSKRLHSLSGAAVELPDGAMIAAEGAAFLIADGRAFRWTPAGYQATATAPVEARLLTPPATVRALAAGYRPILHPSLKAD